MYLEIKGNCIKFKGFIKLELSGLYKEAPPPLPLPFCDFIICGPRYFMIIFKTNFVNLSEFFLKIFQMSVGKNVNFHSRKYFLTNNVLESLCWVNRA